MYIFSSIYNFYFTFIGEKSYNINNNSNIKKKNKKKKGSTSRNNFSHNTSYTTVVRRYTLAHLCTALSIHTHAQMPGFAYVVIHVYREMVYSRCHKRLGSTYASHRPRHVSANRCVKSLSYLPLGRISSWVKFLRTFFYS